MEAVGRDTEAVIALVARQTTDVFREVSGLKPQPLPKRV